MKRRLLDFLTVLSLLLLAATVGLIVVSRFRTVAVVCRQTLTSVIVVGVHGGGVYFMSIVAPPPGWWRNVPLMLDDWTMNLLGFKFGPEMHWPGTPDYVIVPFWFLLLAEALLATMCFLARWWTNYPRSQAAGGFEVAANNPAADR